MAVRLGPAAPTFAGIAKVDAHNEANSTTTVKASGTDAEDRGATQAIVHFSLQPEGGGTRVNVHTDLQLSGSVAQYGRAPGLIADVADQIFRQFERDLTSKLAAVALFDDAEKSSCAVNHLSCQSSPDRLESALARHSAVVARLRIKMRPPARLLAPKNEQKVSLTRTV